MHRPPYIGAISALELTSPPKKKNRKKVALTPGSLAAGAFLHTAMLSVRCPGHMSPPPSDVMMPPEGVPGWKIFPEPVVLYPLDRKNCGSGITCIPSPREVFRKYGPIVQTCVVSGLNPVRNAVREGAQTATDT